MWRRSALTLPVASGATRKVIAPVSASDLGRLTPPDPRRGPSAHLLLRYCTLDRGM
jgi:hypothetical protein